MGRWAVVLAAVLFVAAILFWIRAPRSEKLEKLGRWTFAGGCLSLFASFASLAALFIGNRFEYEYVWGHADSLNTVPYRIAGIWSGQQGSFLLWACSAAVFGLLAASRVGLYRRWFTVAYAVFLGSIAGILIFESPFNLIRSEGQIVVPAEGVGLAPSLQNYWVTIHPPTIFLGFGSLTVLFALAFAALCVRNYDAWVPIVRSWAIVSLTLVGVGLCMGGFWAYETLGWGGFWMWDPVENVSFVPWCLTAALVHGLIVQTTKKKWKMGNLLMGGLPFISFVYGTFLTRSGLLADASVHSFAEMDRSALKLLIGVAALTTGAFAVMWFARTAQFKREAEEVEPSARGVRREGFYLAGVILLIAMGLATAIGMSVPFFLALAGKPAKVVEENLYHQVLPFVFVPLMIIMAVAPFVGWRMQPMREVLGKAYTIACLAIGVTGLALLAAVTTPYSQVLGLGGTSKFPGGMEVKALPWFLTLVGLCAFVIIANLWRMIEVGRRSKLGFSPFLAHIGVGVLMAGLIISRAFEQHDETVVMQDHPGQVLNYGVVLKGMTSNKHDRNNAVKLDFVDPKDPSNVLFTATPGLYYVVQQNGEENPMVWPHIERHSLFDTYVTIHPPQTQASEDIPLEVGREAIFSGIKILYKKMVMEGSAGSAGTKFAAELEITSNEGTKTVRPKLELASTGAVQHPADIDDALKIALVSMNAADRSVVLQVQLASPMYPVEVFHKPMTALVWIGTGLMTLAGFLAAAYRRVTIPATTTERAKRTRPGWAWFVPFYRRHIS